jgi:hypothetical protein
MFDEHKNNNIYIIRCYNKEGNDLIKVGYSDHMKERLTTYYYHNPFIDIITTCYLETAKE